MRDMFEDPRSLAFRILVLHQEYHSSRGENADLVQTASGSLFAVIFSLNKAVRRSLYLTPRLQKGLCAVALERTELSS